MKRTKIDIALVVGHSRRDVGAYNSDLNEKEFYNNNSEAYKIQAQLTNYGITSAIIYRDENVGSYGRLPHIINLWNSKLVVSLHHNSTADKSVGGTEVLYANTSKKGKWIADKLQTAIVQALGYNDRGIKPTKKKQNGGKVLHKTKSVCVLLEPCFMSNNDEFSNFITHTRDKTESPQDTYTKAVARCLNENLENLHKKELFKNV